MFRHPAQQSIGIVGCGRMGSALAHVFSRCGYQVLLASRQLYSAYELALELPGARAGSPDWVGANAGILILATPYSASCGELAQRLRPVIADRTVVDVCNPGMDCGPQPSWPAAVQIARALRSAHVVKALNCIPAGWLAGFPASAPAVTVPVAADDPEAKQQVSSLLQDVGFDVADAGPLCNSTWIEGLAELLAHAQAASALPEYVGFRLLHLSRDQGSDRQRTLQESAVS